MHTSGFVGRLIILSLACCPLLPARHFFVATTGSDAGAGAADQPFLTITRAVSAAAAGDTIIVRGGLYPVPTRIAISTSGTSGVRSVLQAAPGEQPVLDCSSMPLNSSNQGLRLSGSYWHISGLDIRGAGDNGMFISGSHNIIERCAFHGNRDTGLQLGGGAAGNRIINCDAYDNADPGQGNADGFAPKLDVGTGNVFIGCRAWQNSDDGWDGYLRGANDVTTTLIDCWCFMNGYLQSGAASAGNGNGYKTGGSDTRDLEHNVLLQRCLAFDNRVKGFDQNNNRGSITLYNCTAYRNGTNYAVADTLAYASGKVLTVVNCAALGAYGTLRSNAVQRTNSWMGPAVGSADFISIDTAGVRGPRRPDGSLPDLQFMHPAAGSRLIDAGTDIGLPYFGAAPDLGAFETLPAADVRAVPGRPEEGFQLLQAYPNPFNPATTIACVLPEPGEVTIRIFDVQGVLVREIAASRQPAGLCTAGWDGRGGRGNPAASGVYVARISFKNQIRTARLLLLR